MHSNSYAILESSDKFEMPMNLCNVPMLAETACLHQESREFIITCVFMLAFCMTQTSLFEGADVS